MASEPRTARSPLAGLGVTCLVLAFWYVAALPSPEMTAGAFTSQAANASTMSTATLAAPANVQAVALDHESIEVTWDLVAFPHPVDYEVCRSESTGGPYAPCQFTGAPPFVDSGLADETTYYYIVRAHASGWQSPDSSEAAATTEPEPPPPDP